MKNLFRKIIILLRLRRIRNKYFAVMIGISLPPIFILGLISYNIAKDTLVQSQLQAAANHLNSADDVADSMFRNIINMERLISWNKEIHQELKNSAADEGEEQEAIGVRTTRRMQDLISRYLIDIQQIDSVCLFDMNYRSVCYGKSASAGVYDRGGKHKEIAQSDWYKKSVEANGKVLFFGYNVLTETKSGSTFSSVKLLKDPEQLFSPQVTGLLVINVKKSMFSGVFNEGENSTFAVFDSSGKEVKTVYKSPALSYKESSSRKGLTSAFKALEKEGYLLSAHKNQTTGWTFVGAIEEKELLRQSNQIGMVTGLIAFLIAIVALLLSFILSGKIARPLVQLKKAAASWSNDAGNGGETGDKDEIDTISKTFNRVTEKNKELSERLIHPQLKEREAELRALQAQIKPHFLYNTLDSIYWMAAMQNNDEIAKMAIALSESFKLSLNNGKDFIAVSKELEHIKYYMTIQNIRYNNRFQYIEDVEPALMDKEILKLLLQPLVENAIYHGLEPKVGEGTIWVKGKMDEDWIVFTVEDDGVGIENLEVTEKGYGLRNVRERIELYYGSASTLTISSEVNKGTRVEIRIRG